MNDKVIIKYASVYRLFFIHFAADENLFNDIVAIFRSEKVPSLSEISLFLSEVNEPEMKKEIGFICQIHLILKLMNPEYANLIWNLYFSSQPDTTVKDNFSTATFFRLKSKAIKEFMFYTDLPTISNIKNNLDKLMY